MKNFTAFLLVLLLTATACQEEEVANRPITKVVYEVLTTSGDWFGEYTIETGEKVCICESPLAPSGWRYAFEVTSQPIELHIDASSECCHGQTNAPDVTTNIYVNDTLVASNTSNWAPGVASADYRIE